MGLNLSVSTWEDRREPVDDQAYEVRWHCATHSYDGVAAAQGSVEITQVTLAGTRVKSIGLTWDLACQREINSPSGVDGALPLRHWTGSATFNS